MVERRGGKGGKDDNTRELVTEPVYFLFLQNTNTRTFVSEGVAVHETVTAGVHLCFFFLFSF